MNSSSIESLLNRIEENQRQTNSMLQDLINILSVSIDLASGENVLNKDFLDDEVRKGFFTD
jgi:hypothetical protein